MSESFVEHDDVEAGEAPEPAVATDWNRAPERAAHADRPSPNGVLETLRETAEELLSLHAEWETHAQELQATEGELQERSEHLAKAEDQVGQMRSELKERAQQVAEAETALAALGAELTARYANSPR